MKNVIKLLLLSPMAILSTGCQKTQNTSKESSEEKSSISESTSLGDPTPVDVIIISGQSNAVGCTRSSCITRSIGASKYSEYMKGYNNIKIAYDCWTKDEGPRFYSQNSSKNDDFVKVMLGQGNSEATFGPEIGIAEAMTEKYGDKLYIIKYACGASNLKDDWVSKDSPMYGRFVKYIKKQMDNLKSKNLIPTIKAFCWMQGEGDSYEGYYQDYYKNTKAFVTNLREELKELSGNKDFPFIDAGINNSKDPNTGALIWQYYRKVNEAKKQFAEESDNNFYIDTIAAGMHTSEEPFGDVDACHYDTESEVLLGHLFAEQFEQFLMPVEE